jgi:hypothetical protein
MAATRKSKNAAKRNAASRDKRVNKFAKKGGAAKANKAGRKAANKGQVQKVPKSMQKKINPTTGKPYGKTIRIGGKASDRAAQKRGEKAMSKLNKASSKFGGGSKAASRASGGYARSQRVGGSG